MNQKQHEIATLLKPLITQFGILSDDKMRLYTEKLERFSFSVITKGVESLLDKWDKISFPPVGALVSECNSHNAPAVTGNTKKEFPWEKRNRDIRKMANDFTVGYMNTAPIVQQATAGQWYNWLYDYVKTVAYLQAQMYYKSPNVGIDWWCVIPENIKPEDQDSWKREFLRENENMVFAEGRIVVNIPDDKIQEWIAKGKLVAIKKEITASK